MKKLISSFLLVSAIVTAPMAFANNQHTYLAMINNSSFKTKVQEGLAYKSTWLLEPGESKDS